MIRLACIRAAHLKSARPKLTPRLLTPLIFALVLLLSLAPLSPARAEGIFVPAAQRIDMVNDPARNLLYITNGGSILRYDLTANTFLPAFVMPSTSVHLMGIDLSPDGNTLVAADSRYSVGYNWVWIVDLTTGAIRQQTFPTSFYEAGTFAVAFGSDGKCLVSSNFAGSGWVPLRRLDPATGAYSVIATVNQASMLSASGDGSVIGVAESNSSDGPVARYRVADGSWLERTGYAYGTSWFNFEIAVNHDGSQYSVPTYDGTFIYDGNLLKTGQMVGGYASAGQPIGAAYHPVRNTVYYAWSGTPYVYAYDAATLTRIASYNVAFTFQWTGNSAFYDGRLRISRDGSLLFATVGDPYYANSPALGVRIIRLAASPTADNKSVTMNEDGAAPVTLSGSSGNGGAVGYSVLSQPAHGALSGTAPNLVYTPAADYNGPDSFTYAALSGGLQSAPATVSITVNPVNDAPRFTAGPDQTVDEDSGPRAVTGWATNISPGPANESGQAVSFLVSNDNSGLFSAQPAVSSSGTLTFTPALHAYGKATVTVRARDNGGTANGGVDTSAPQTFVITVNFVNHPPAANDDLAVTRKTSPVTINVLGNDSDPDGDALRVVSVTQGAKGSVVINADGTLTYQPGKRASASDTFTYTIQDTHGATAAARVTVTFTTGKPAGKGHG